MYGEYFSKYDIVGDIYGEIGSMHKDEDRWIFTPIGRGASRFSEKQITSLMPLCGEELIYYMETLPFDPPTLAISCMKEVLEKLLPENYSIYYIREHKCIVTIKFPTIHIVSESGAEHNISDVYISLVCYTSNPEASYMFDCISLYGVRGKLTVDELAANFQFPHMSPSDFMNYSGFCYGNYSQPSLKSRDRLQSMPKDKVEEFKIEFEYFIAALEGYLSWQSNIGGPYRYIEKLGGLGDGSFKMSVPASTTLKVLVQNMEDAVVLDMVQTVDNLVIPKFEINEKLLERKVMEYCIEEKLPKYIGLSLGDGNMYTYEEIEEYNSKTLNPENVIKLSIDKVQECNEYRRSLPFRNSIVPLELDIENSRGKKPLIDINKCKKVVYLEIGTISTIVSILNDAFIKLILKECHKKFEYEK